MKTDVAQRAARNEQRATGQKRWPTDLACGLARSPQLVARGSSPVAHGPWRAARGASP
ncbi:MAG: hypothetical protein U1F31_06350 [Steroidobacteraceae bacterium]